MKKIFAMLAMVGCVNAMETTPVDGETLNILEKDISERKYDLLALGAKQASLLELCSNIAFAKAIPEGHSRKEYTTKFGDIIPAESISSGEVAAMAEIATKELARQEEKARLEGTRAHKEFKRTKKETEKRVKEMLITSTKDRDRSLMNKDNALCFMTINKKTWMASAVKSMGKKNVTRRISREMDPEFKKTLEEALQAYKEEERENNRVRKTRSSHNRASGATPVDGETLNIIENNISEREYDLLALGFSHLHVSELGNIIDSAHAIPEGYSRKEYTTKFGDIIPAESISSGEVAAMAEIATKELARQEEKARLGGTRAHKEFQRAKKGADKNLKLNNNYITELKTNTSEDVTKRNALEYMASKKKDSMVRAVEIMGEEKATQMKVTEMDPEFKKTLEEALEIKKEKQKDRAMNEDKKENDRVRKTRSSHNRALCSAAVQED